MVAGDRNSPTATSLPAHKPLHHIGPARRLTTRKFVNVLHPLDDGSIQQK